MPSWVHKFIIISLVFSCISKANNTTDPGLVVVVANQNSASSVQLAQYYLKKRKVPKSNLILLDVIEQETISNKVFVNDIWNPLRKKLLKKSLLEGELFRSKSLDGCLKYSPQKTNFQYLLICKGIPLKIKNEPSLVTKENQTVQNIFKTTQSSIDSELALIATENKYRTGFTENPLFQKDKLSQLDRSLALPVCRIDGPSYESARRIIDSSILAEKTPLIEGRAYIDQYPKYKVGNKWLQEAADSLIKFGYDVDLDKTEKHWNLKDRNDQPAIYLGWYHNQASGPAVAPYKSIPNGAIAAHIHSYSAASIWNSKGWVGPLIKSGFAVSFGNVYEPYLELTLRPDIFIKSLLDGHCVAHASISALPKLSWQNVTIADPLYTPFPKNSQIKDAEENDVYASLIKLNRIAKADRSRAFDTSVELFIKSPHLLIAYKILDQYEDLASPTMKRTLKDYITNTQIQGYEYIPIYLDILANYLSNEDMMYQKLLGKLIHQQYQWPKPLIEEFEKIRNHSFQDQPASS